MTTTHPLLGQQIDQYRIISHIARGGMADVYLAEDVSLERKVAFKVMLDTLVAIDSQFIERFRQEARTVAKLDHPNIVQIYTIGHTPAEQPYIAMQYIEGGSLQDKLKELANRKKLLTTEQALNIVRQIALALSAAHKVGIIHRDLKPANVLVRPDGTPVLVDLGIASIKGGAKLTQTGGIIGTPAYMSPEQVRGRPLDGRSDLYALGIMLYEILAGIRPFEADESVAILHKQVYEEPLPLDKLRPDLSAETLSVVATALQKDPAHRHPSADAMVSAIDAAIRAEGMSGPNPQATMVLTQMSDSKLLSRRGLILPPNAMQKKRPAWVWAVALLFLLVAAIFAFFAFRSDDEQSIVTAAITNTAVPLIQPTASPTALPASPTIEPSATPLPPTVTIAPTLALPTTIPAITTENVTASRLDLPPFIDGDLSDWARETAVSSAYTVYRHADWDGSDDVEAYWQLGWDASNLYVAVIVRDDIHVQIKADEQIYRGDSIEMQIDTNLDGDYNTPISADDFQLNISPGDFENVPTASYLWRADNGRYSPTSREGIQQASRPLPDGGYIIEAAIPWNNLAIAPEAGLRIGLALNISDNDQAGTAVQEMMKSNVETRTYGDPATWGTLTLR